MRRHMLCHAVVLVALVAGSCVDVDRYCEALPLEDGQWVIDSATPYDESMLGAEATVVGDSVTFEYQGAEGTTYLVAYEKEWTQE